MNLFFLRCHVFPGCAALIRATGLRSITRRSCSPDKAKGRIRGWGACHVFPDALRLSGLRDLKHHPNNDTPGTNHSEIPASPQPIPVAASTSLG